MEGFIKQQDYTVQGFYTQLQAEASERHSDADTFVQVITAGVDFEMFVQMMRYAKEGEL